jgi:hypothetical protein
MSEKLRATDRIAVAALVLLLSAVATQAQFIVGINADFGTGQITTYNFANGATVNSFLPTGSFANNGGRGLLVVGNNVYYTELSAFVGPTDFIRIAPFNGGAGGADIGTLPNPRPGVGVQDLAFFGGVLYVLTGQYGFVPQVFGLNPATGAIVSGPVSIASPALDGSDGFTVLPNGNFLINSGDSSCTYNQYSPSTGALIAGTTIVVPGGSLCTGVETDGTSLFFQTNFNRFTKTTLAGALISSQAVLSNIVEDISVVLESSPFAGLGTPGQANCHGNVVSALASKYGGLSDAASALGYPSVGALQNAIKSFCGS